MKQLVKITLQRHHNVPDTFEVSRSVHVQEGRFFYGVTFAKNEVNIIRKPDIGRVIDNPCACNHCIFVTATRYDESPETYKTLLSQAI